MHLSAVERVAVRADEPASRKATKWSVYALAGVIAIVALAAWAAADYRAGQIELGDAYRLYPPSRPLSYADLNTYAASVADAADVSQNRGRLIVEAMLRAHLDPQNWVQAAHGAPHFWASEGDQIAADGLY